MAAGVPFTPSLEWAIGPDGSFWHGITNEYRLVQSTPEGDTLRVIEKEWTPVPVDPAERDSLLAGEFMEQLRQRGVDVDPSRVPATKPAWQDLWFDDAGYLWVAPTRAPGTAKIADVFDPEGYYLGGVELPEGTMTMLPPVVRGNRMYLIASDDFGVSYVVIGRLEGRTDTPLEAGTR